MKPDQLGEDIVVLFEARSAPIGLDELVLRRGGAAARVRSSRRRGLLVVAAAFAAAIIVFGPLVWVARDGAEPASTTPSERFGGFDVTYRASGPTGDDSSLEVTYPASWYRSTEDLTPNAGLTQRFAIATFPMPPGGEQCVHMPVAAMEELGPADVFLYLEERGPVGSSVGWEPRPASFAEWLTGIDDGTDAWECLSAPGRRDIGVLRWVPFEDSGRGLYLLVAIGTDASDEDVATAARILDSLVVQEP